MGRKGPSEGRISLEGVNRIDSYNWAGAGGTGTGRPIGEGKEAGGEGGPAKTKDCLKAHTES